ncbi:carbohydrate kinase family protein [Streptomyces sp. H27-D2]|uniref:carbohydrate kinase family protein n=1 Tax=Streptomyces sp. H27-D2 TaxID=3046304 RepID=UPI002DBBDE79|nr:carbohydrate kinase [Streptomyces sp. H27-D2]MEC4019238.1 carbohydrate kinase [Streptomyces sp. H27-D2]
MSAGTPVAVLGECVADAFAAPREPGRPGLDLSVMPGGGPANTAVALARLGTRTNFLGRLSGDVFGRLFRERLSASGVDLTGCPEAAEPSTLAVADLDELGRAHYTFHAEHTADWQWTEAELSAGLPADAACLHTGSLALVRDPGAARIEALLAAARPHATISLDPNVRPLLVDPERYRERMPHWCSLADIVRLSEDDLEHLYPGREAAEVCDDWHRLGVRLVVVTMGPGGALASLDGRRIPVAGEPVEVVDSVGAGDAFMAGLLHRLHQGGLLGGRLDDLDEERTRAAVVFGNRVAAATCAVRGADSPWGEDF